MIDKLVAALKGRELSAMARIVLDYYTAHTGTSRRDLFIEYTAHLESELETSQIDSLIATAQATPKPASKAALQTVACHAIDISKDEDVLAELIGEAKRRADTPDHAGKDTPDWIKGGNVGNRKSVASGETGAVPAEATTSEPPLLRHGKGKLSREEAKRAVSLVANLVGIEENKGSQKPLWKTRGEYLIFRYLFSEDKVLVSHMEISEPLSDDLPAVFCTKGGEGMGNDHDFRFVQGAAYKPTGSYDLVSFGPIPDGTNLRMAYLTRISKESPIDSSIVTDNAENKDLYGIRLSPGSHIRKQVAHRLWCSKLLGDACELRTKVGSYDLDKAREEFGKTVDDFDRLLVWITAVGTMNMDKVYDGLDLSD